MKTICNAVESDKSILVVGADGVIGQRLLSVFEKQGRHVFGSSRRKIQSENKRFFIDLAENGSQYTLPAGEISAAFLCASITSMEFCQLHPKWTRNINIHNTVNLAKQLLDRGSQIIFLSSNTVFDGKTEFARETDLVNPQTEYGLQKAEAEQKLLSLDKRVSVVRFSKIISPDMPMLNQWIRDLLSGRVIYPFSDKVMAPLSISFVLELLMLIHDKCVTGIIPVSYTHLTLPTKRIV